MPHNGGSSPFAADGELKNPTWAQLRAFCMRYSRLPVNPIQHHCIHLFSNEALALLILLIWECIGYSAGVKLAAVLEMLSTVSFPLTLQ